MSYQATYVRLAFFAVWHMAQKPSATREGLNAEIMRLIKWAYLVHSKGLIGLEGEIGTKIQEPYCVMAWSWWLRGIVLK